MPGLVRGVARTAVVAGTATAVSNRVSRRQGNRWAAKEEQQYAEQAPPPQYYEPAPAAPAPAYAPPPPPAAPEPAPAPAPLSSTDRVAALKDLAELHAAGVLTDAEFSSEKARILSS
jgi:hypothetical protein